MASDMGKPEQVRVAAHEVDEAFFRQVRAAALRGLGFVQEVRGLNDKKIKAAVEAEFLLMAEGDEEHVTVAVRGSFVNAFAITFLEYYGRAATKKVFGRMIAYAVRGQRYLAKTFCSLRPEDVVEFRRAVEINPLVKTGAMGAWTLSVVARELHRNGDLVVWYPSANEDMMGIDLVITNPHAPHGAYLQVKSSNSGATLVVRDAGEAWDIGGNRLLELFEQWHERSADFALRFPDTTWFPFFVLSGERCSDELEKLSIIANTVRGVPTTTTPT